MEFNSVSWTPHGGVEDLEPPDEVWAHVDCWNNLSQIERNYEYKEAWIPPIIKIDENKEFINELRQINSKRKRTSKAIL